MFKNSKAIILLGPPGSGKTALATHLSAYEDVTTIKVEELLKDEVRKRSWWGDQLKLYLDNGLFPPARLIKEVIVQSVEWASSDLIIFEGFPGSMEEINSFFEIEIREELVLTAIIILELSLESSLERIDNRLVCKSCGGVFNLTYYPPRRRKTCDWCGKTLCQRKDDSVEKVRERVMCFEERTMPVIDHFKRQYPEKTFVFNAEKSLMELITPALKVVRGKSFGNKESVCNKNSRR